MHVVHLLTKESIEERVWETLRLKKSLFAGVFDSPVAEVSFEALGKKSVLQSVKEIFANQPGRPKPVIDPPPPVAVPLASAPVAPPVPVNGAVDAAAGLIEAGVRLLESLASGSGEVDGLVTKDPRTGRPQLAIPLPQGFDAGRLTRTLAGAAAMVRAPAVKAGGPGPLSRRAG